MATKRYKLCSVCGKSKRLEQFSRDVGKPGGLRTVCRACSNARRKGLVSFSMPVYCRYCGADCSDEETTNDVCHQCKVKDQGFRQGECWLCTHDPTGTRLWLGGHFTGTEAKESLSVGVMPEGAVYEVWKDKQYVNHVVIVGEEGKPQIAQKLPRKGYKAQGDRRFLVP